jgi:ribosomal protein S8
MSRYKNQIINVLKERGFTGDFQLYYWNNDGWYCDCDQLCFQWIGQNVLDAIHEIKKGYLDKYLKTSKTREVKFKREK